MSDDNVKQVVIAELIEAANLEFGCIRKTIARDIVLKHLGNDSPCLAELFELETDDVMGVVVVKATTHDKIRMVSLIGEDFTLHVRDKRYTRT